MALPILDGNQSATTLSTILTGGQHIPAHTVVSLGSQAITDMRGAVSGSVVSISNFPASQTVAGTVTANVAGNLNLTIESYDESLLQLVVGVHIKDLAGNVIGTSVAPMPISGTVTANLFGEAVGGGPNEPTKLQCDSNGFLISSLYRSGGDAVNYDPVAGNVSVNVKAVSSVTVGAMPSGALTTRFGSVTTANTAQLTSAVTNTSRKYLLVQNIATSTVTIGIGFAPTTTQGIQLTAGAGLTFDAFCPTGGVWWLSSTTGSNFSILEG